MPSPIFAEERRSMSDHFSGPRAVADPVADIADMNVFPLATASALFSDAFWYRFRVRPARIAASGRGATFVVDEPEYTVSCSFAAPRAGDGSTRPVQQGTCITSTGAAVTFRVHDEQGGMGSG